MYEEVDGCGAEDGKCVILGIPVEGAETGSLELLQGDLFDVVHSRPPGDPSFPLIYPILSPKAH